MFLIALVAAHIKWHQAGGSDHENKTSAFSQGARDYADSIENKIVLIDGEELAGLMIDYGVGVSTTNH